MSLSPEVLTPEVPNSSHASARSRTATNVEAAASTSAGYWAGHQLEACRTEPLLRGSNDDGAVPAAGAYQAPRLQEGNCSLCGCRGHTELRPKFFAGRQQITSHDHSVADLSAERGSDSFVRATRVGRHKIRRRSVGTTGGHPGNETRGCAR